MFTECSQRLLSQISWRTEGTAHVRERHAGVGRGLREYRVQHIDALVDLRPRRLAQPDAVVREVVELRISEQHDVARSARGPRWRRTRFASLPGRFVPASVSAALISRTHVLVPRRLQSSMIEANPSSLPPMVRLTRVVGRLSARHLPVASRPWSSAPEQATDT